MDAVVILEGSIGPVEAVDLRVQLADATNRPRPHVHLDLQQVTDLHLSAVAAIIAGTLNARRRSGTFVIMPPDASAPRRELELSLIHI